MNHIPCLSAFTTSITKLSRFMITLVLFVCMGSKASGETMEYKAEVLTTVSGGEHSPFWLVNNQQGLGTPKRDFGYVRGEAIKKLNLDKKFSWGAGIDLVGGWKMTAPFNIHQLYGEIKYRALYAMVGQKEIWGEYNDHKLSSGNLLISGNAMPIPQIRLGTYDFASFWGTKNWFSVKAYLSFGKFTDSNWQSSWVAPGSQHNRGTLYNSRGLWLRGGNKEKFPLIAEVGIEMCTQFGGTIYKDGEIIKMPEKFIDWVKAIIPYEGGEDTPEGEQTNVQGNMNGVYNISIQWQPKSNWYIKGYFEHYFEDHSQMTFEYGWKDAQWGIEIKFPDNKYVSKFVGEYIYMKDQTGSVNHNWSPEVPEQVSGGDKYYNHYLYSAWQNWGMGIGTPLAISPIYNTNHHLTFFDTRFIAYHIGLEGNPIQELDWRFLLTFTQNWGTYLHPLVDVLNNCSGLVEIKYSPVKLKGWYAKAAVAWDKGNLLGKSFGGMLTIGKEGLIEWKNQKK